MKLPPIDQVRLRNTKPGEVFTETDGVIDGKACVITRIGNPSTVRFLENNEPRKTLDLKTFLKARPEEVCHLRHVRIRDGRSIVNLGDLKTVPHYIEIAGSPAAMLRMRERIQLAYEAGVWRYHQKPGRMSSAFKRTFCLQFRYDIVQNPSSFPLGYTFEQSVEDFKSGSRRADSFRHQMRQVA